MTATTDTYTLLRAFASKQGTFVFFFSDFCEYIKRYASHYLEEQPDLIIYLENPQEPLLESFEDLELNGKIAVRTGDQGKKEIVIPALYIEKLVNRYKEIRSNPSVPFPGEHDIPKNFPDMFIQNVHLPEELYQLYDKDEKKENTVYRLLFQREEQPMIFPGVLSAQILLELSLAKVRSLFRKDESRDYFIKKLTIANPGKELSSRNFILQFLGKPTESLETMKEAGDSFYYWNQLCIFIRQDYEKTKDKTPEDISLIQSVYLIEFSNSYYKNKTQQTLQRTTALKNLELALKKVPYYFDMDTISRFTDSRGIPLLGQYTQEDLSNFLRTATTTASFENLPDLLTFKLENGSRYYIYREKVIPLVIRLCGDARNTVKENITEKWKNSLKQFKTDPAMKDQKIFEKTIENAVKTESPVLQALLKSSFLSLVFYDGESTKQYPGQKITLFSNGKLLPYSRLLMLNRQEILTDAKILLPFWYTIPVISAIIGFFFAPRGPKKEKEEKRSEAAQTEEPVMRMVTQEKPRSRKEEFRHAAAEIEKELVPPNSSLDLELN